MGYINKEVIENVTHTKAVGMKCDNCGSTTYEIGNSSWHEFYSKMDDYPESELDWNVVCSGYCFIEFLKKKITSRFFSNIENVEISDMTGPFIKNLIEWADKKGE